MKTFKKHIALFHFLFLSLWIISLIYLGYQIHLSFIGYDESYSAPLFLSIMLETYLWLIVSFILCLIWLVTKRVRKNEGVLNTKFNLINRFKAHKLRFTLITFTLLVLSLMLAIIFIQPIILYHPNHSSFAYQELINLDVYETFEISDDSLTYQGFGYIDQDKIQPTIIYFGGNGESSAQTFYEYHKKDFFSHIQGYNFIMIDYPGYGLSEGITSDYSITKMADRVYDYIASLPYVNSSEIYIYGYSIGTGVATYISSIKDVKGLILIAPYSSIKDLFNSRLPIFKGIGENLITEEFPSYLYAKDCQIKPLIIVSRNDKTIPIEVSLKLAGIFLVQPDIFILEDEAHNEFLDNNDVIEQITNYLNH
jgi:pimeloyl-ACP methyl ester carboxylesterase